MLWRHYRVSLICLVIFFCGLQIQAQHTIYQTSTGIISFRSDAPLEIITASSKKLEGLIDLYDMSFAFNVKVRSFEGFNNGLQREHFYENYMETDKYETATFSGKIIERTNLQIPGIYTVRAKGQLTIHGHTRERIIKTEIISTGSELKAKASFIIPLVDHQIEVPRIVNQKIAQEIQVVVQGTFHLRDKS
jgi:polyisoprenoid-binding protein YceI